MRKKRRHVRRILDQVVECPNCHTLQHKLVWDQGTTYRSCSACKKGMSIEGPVATPVDWRDS